ncbi:MAG: hypothetical protein ACPG1C_01645 [Alphaproteobacteria bacterium]
MMTLNQMENWHLPHRAAAAALGGLMMIGALALSTTARAEADDAASQGDDIVVLTQSAEDWVETSTPKITVSIDAAFEEKGAASVRQDLKAALGKLAKAEWRFVTMNRHRGEAGLERWRVTAEARIPDSKAVGLYGKAKSASRTGMQLKIGNISYEPTRKELEAAQAKLRASLYAEALAERDRLNKAIPGRKWRIGAVDFTNTLPIQPVVHHRAEARAYAMSADMAPKAGASGLSISKKQVLTARVVLMSSAD